MKQQGMITGRPLTSAAHYQNQAIWNTAAEIALDQGFVLRRNSTTINASFDGYHRYVVLEIRATNVAINSPSCKFYSEARYSKYGQPSIVGEKRAIRELLNWLQKE